MMAKLNFRTSDETKLLAEKLFLQSNVFSITNSKQMKLSSFYCHSIDEASNASLKDYKHMSTMKV